MAYYNRGLARYQKADLDGAIADQSKAIEIDHGFAPAYYHRGLARHKSADFDGAIADYNKAIKIDPRAFSYNSLAWLLATSSKKGVRDGKTAVEHAREAAELTNWEDANVLDTLAAAYAEAGNFEEAVKWEIKALSFPEFAQSYGEEARKRLQLYTERKPYHESMPK